MSKPLSTSDFRAVRIVLESEDFAEVGVEPEPLLSNLIDEKTWHEIMDLPDDASIRTSNHHGNSLSELNRLNEAWLDAIGNNQDILFEAMIYSVDEFQAIIFNLIHGYYRQAIGCLRNILELV